MESNSNPWFPRYKGVGFLPDLYDYVFLAGMDWNAFGQSALDPTKPVINLIQHVRHSSPTEDVYPFLAHRAIRICVSPEVENAIKPLVNGPIVTISNGIAIPPIEVEKTD